MLKCHQRPSCSHAWQATEWACYLGFIPSASTCFTCHVTAEPIFITSGFWPRLRARALRAPVFLGSLPRQTGRYAPLISAHRSFLFDPKKFIKSVELGSPTSRAFFFPQDHRGHEIWGPPAPRPAHHSFADPSGNNLGVKIMYRCHHTP